MKTDTRYPYTHACDYIRMFGGYSSAGVALSRSDALQIALTRSARRHTASIRSAIADAIGIPDEELAKRLADYYLTNQDELVNGSVDKMFGAGL